jgi:hypothetical protein
MARFEQEAMSPEQVLGREFDTRAVMTMFDTFDVNGVDR